MEEGKKHVFIADKASIIRDALSILRAALEPESDVSPGAREKLEAISKEECDNIILELQVEGESCGGMSPGVRNIRTSYMGRVLVVRCEIADPRILQQIMELHRLNFCLMPTALAVAAFINMLS